MNVSKKSWHYKLVKFFWSFPEEDLCGYFRQVLLSIAIAISFLIFLLILVPLSFGGAIASLLESVTLISSIKSLSSLVLLCLGYLFLFTIASLIFCIILIFSKCKECFKNKRKSAVKTNSTYSLAKEYVKSKKERYCSSITFKD